MRNSFFIFGLTIGIIVINVPFTSIFQILVFWNSITRSFRNASAYSAVNRMRTENTQKQIFSVHYRLLYTMLTTVQRIQKEKIFSVQYGFYTYVLLVRSILYYCILHFAPGCPEIRAKSSARQPSAGQSQPDHPLQYTTASNTSMFYIPFACF